MAFLSKDHSIVTEMNTENIELENARPIPLLYGYICLIFTIILFMIINKCVTSHGPPKSVHVEFWKWKNLFISWMHALVVSLWNLYSFYMYPGVQEDPIDHVNLCTYTLVAFSTGYFLYDFCDIILSGKAGSDWEIIMHHIAVAGMFLWNVLNCHCIGYNCLALMAEVNSLFLHSRKLLQMHQCSYQHWFYRFICYINLVTFLLCRFVPNSYIYFGMFTQHHRVSWQYLYTLGAAMIVMTAVNVVLFQRLFRSDILRPFSSSRQNVSSESIKTHHKNGIANHLSNNNLTLPLKSKHN